MTTVRFRTPYQIRLLRLAWLALAIYTLVLFGAAAVARYQYELGQAQALFAESLARFGLPGELYALVRVAAEALVVLVASGVAALVFWRRPEDTMAILTSAMLLIFNTTVGQAMPTLVITHPGWALPVLILALMGNTLLILFLLVFPNGRFVPRWSKYVLLLMPVQFIAELFSRFSGEISTVSISTMLLIAIGLFGVGCQVYRFYRVTLPIQRQQTKWVLYGLVLTSVILVVQTGIDFLVTPWLVQHPDVRLVYRMTVTVLLGYGTLTIVPLSFGLAILRYRLWDIDLTVNRSLVFGMMTVLLLIPFSLVFVGVQVALSLLLGTEQTGLALAAAGLATGALFEPARRRVRHVVDRRFFRLRFDLDELQQAQRERESIGAGALTGQQLGDYMVHDLLGRGGMGDVYRAIHISGDSVALKILADRLVDDKMWRVRFEREVQTLLRLQHPNIVQMHGAGQHEHVYYMAVEFINGEHLGQFIARRGRVPLPEVRAIMADFAGALDYAHAQGFVHRDIKPSNVMLRTSPYGLQVVLMDFGIAKVQDAKTNITGPEAVGSIDYMAPEQITSSRHVDHHADIYALGVVMYEMLTGEKPFTGSAAQVMFAHLQQPPPDPRELVPDLHPLASYAVMRAMAKDPDDRFDSAQALVEALP